MDYQLQYHKIQQGLADLTAAGVLNRLEQYALLDTIETARNQRSPAYPNTLNALDKLLGAVQAAQQQQREPSLLETRLAHIRAQQSDHRPRVAIIGAPDTVAATLAAMQAHPHAGNIEWTGLPMAHHELHIEREPLQLRDVLHHEYEPDGKRGLKVRYETLMGSLFGDADKYGPLLQLQMGLETAPEPPPALFFKNHILEPYQDAPKRHQEPRFNGYMGKQRRGKRRY